MAVKNRPLLSARVKLCPKMIACDGTQVAPGRDLCSKCEQAIARRNKVVVLKGEPRPGSKPLS